MEGFDLPMSFGKSKAKKSDVDQFATSKRADAIVSTLPRPHCLGSRTDSSFDQDPLELPSSKAEVLAREEADKGHVTLEKTRRLPVSEDEDEGEDDEEDDDDDGADWVDQREGADLPVSHEVVMKDHTKVSFSCSYMTPQSWG